MKTIYREAKRELQKQGVNFSKNVYSLDADEVRLLEKAAKKYGYKVAGDGNSAIGCIVHARFFLLLQKIKIN